MTIYQIKKDIAGAKCLECGGSKRVATPLPENTVWTHSNDPCPSCADITTQDRVMKVVYAIADTHLKQECAESLSGPMEMYIEQTYTALCELCVAEGVTCDGWGSELPTRRKYPNKYQKFLYYLTGGSFYAECFAYLAAIAEEQGVEL